MSEARLLLAAELARILRVSKSTLKRLVAEGLPRVHVHGRLHRYDLAAVRAWLAAREAATTNAVGVVH